MYASSYWAEPAFPRQTSSSLSGTTLHRDYHQETKHLLHRDYHQDTKHLIQSTKVSSARLYLHRRCSCRCAKYCWRLQIRTSCFPMWCKREPNDWKACVQMLALSHSIIGWALGCLPVMYDCFALQIAGARFGLTHSAQNCRVQAITTSLGPYTVI